MHNFDDSVQGSRQRAGFVGSNVIGALISADSIPIISILVPEVENGGFWEALVWVLIEFLYSVLIERQCLGHFNSIYELC